MKIKFLVYSHMYTQIVENFILIINIYLLLPKTDVNKYNANIWGQKSQKKRNLILITSIYLIWSKNDINNI